MLSVSLRFALIALLLALSTTFGVGCQSDEAPREVTRYEDVRGRFMGSASGGRDVVIHHEAIPGVMPAMVMSLPVARADEADAIDIDQPVRFDLIVEGSEIRVESLTALPDTTTLDLPAPSEADTTRASAPTPG